MDALVAYARAVIVIESNNDWGSDKMRRVFDEYQDIPTLHFFPSMRFEFFLSILRKADFIVGNSSSGIREAPHYGVPAINLGSRQNNRVRSALVIDTDITAEAISRSVKAAEAAARVLEKNFGDGRSVERFVGILQQAGRWETPVHNQFIDRPGSAEKEK